MRFEPFVSHCFFRYRNALRRLTHNACGLCPKNYHLHLNISANLVFGGFLEGIIELTRHYMLNLCFLSNAIGLSMYAYSCLYISDEGDIKIDHISSKR